MYVNREKIVIQRQSSEDSSESLKPLLNSDEESYVHSSTTYSSITSSSSSSTSPGVMVGRRTSEQDKLSLPSSPPVSPLALTFNTPDRDTAPLMIETKAIVHKT